MRVEHLVQGAKLRIDLGEKWRLIDRDRRKVSEVFSGEGEMLKKAISSERKGEIKREP